MSELEKIPGIKTVLKTSDIQKSLFPDPDLRSLYKNQLYLEEMVIWLLKRNRL